MTFIIILVINVIACLFGIYLFISDETKDHNHEIVNKLEWIERQINLLREEVNELRLQLDDMWKNVKKD